MMERQHTIIEERSHNVAYTLRRSRRAKRIRLAVYYDGKIIVTMPYGVSGISAERFMREKTEWVLHKLSLFKKREFVPPPADRRKEYLKYKKAARELAVSRIAHFNGAYKFRFHGVSIRNQKTRWGSCTRKGNLNFNYKIALLPSRLADYIIVHELCHLKEFNHSKQFWGLVATVLPNYAELRKELRRGVMRLS